MKRINRLMAAIPLALRVPLLVALLMVLVATVISQVVLSRLTREQEHSLLSLSTAFMDGVATAATPGLLRQDIWETFDSLDRARRQYGAINVLYVIVILPNGQVLASSEPDRYPAVSSLPPHLAALVAGGQPLVLDEKTGRAWTIREIEQESYRIGTVLAEIDIKNILAVRREVLWTLILVNGALTAVFSLSGYLLVRRMVRPISVIQQHLAMVQSGHPQAIDERDIRAAGPEHRELYRRFNDMIRSQAEREALAAELANQEKMAMLGRLASGMAHEVNNPLGGLMNAVDTLDVHGDRESVRRRTIDLLRRGLAGIQNVVRAALVTYKSAPGHAHLGRADLEDLPFLIQHETGVKHLTLDWRNDISDDLPIEAPAVRQIALNLLLNACAASPERGAIRFTARVEDRHLVLCVSDSGPGLPDLAYRAVAAGESGDGVPDGLGLGLWTAARLAARLNGKMTLQSGPSQGAAITLVAPLGEEREEEHVVAATRARRAG
ncbi:MAG: HAMP domain-containing histidine kinase [Rhodospirillaceae bacterium]|nr:HAMP domain-containing histidine kinase [Rhodospirillaceae bacterium]